MIFLVNRLPRLSGSRELAISVNMRLVQSEDRRRFSELLFVLVKAKSEPYEILNSI